MKELDLKAKRVSESSDGGSNDERSRRVKESTSPKTFVVGSDIDKWF